MTMKELNGRYPLLMRGLTILAALGLVLLALHVAFRYLLPFVIALPIALAMEPPVRLLARRRVPRSLAVGIVMTVYFGILLAAGFLIASRIAAEVMDLAKEIPDAGRFLAKLFDDLSQWSRSMYLRLPKEVVGPLQQSLLDLAARAAGVMTSLAGSILNLLTSLPNLLLFAMFTLIATFFIARDRDRFSEMFSRMVPAATYAKLLGLKNSLGRSLAGFLKAQLILMTLTFSECFIGLSLLGIRYALVISLLTALVDILPVLGTGTVLLPWALVAIVLGQTGTGVGLLVLYLVMTVIRYALEPRIVGGQLGLHPLVSLMAMFAGLQLLGVAGLLLGPALVVAGQAVMKSGLLPQGK